MRRLSRRLVSVLAVAALAAATGAPAGAEDDARTRSSPEHNVRLTIPETWTWDEPSAADKEAGFVLVARRSVEGEQVTASARVRVVDAGGSSLESLLGMVKDAKSKDLSGVTSDEAALEWAGVPARRLQVSGKHEGGGLLFFEVYGAIVGGKFHQLDLRCVNGAEEKVREELNELAAAYALIEPPAAADGGAPAGEAPKQVFAKYAFTWTLPKPATLPPEKEGEAPRTLRWGFDRGDGPRPDELPGEGRSILLARAGVVLDEGGPNPILVELRVQRAPVGMTAQLVAENDHNFEGLLESFSDVPAPRLDKDADIGNLPGASRTFTGKDKQEKPRPLYIRSYFGVLKDWMFQVLVVAHDRAESTHRKSLNEAMAGFHFEGADSLGIRGPRVTSFPTYTDLRPDAKDDVGREVPVVMPAVSLKKPAVFGRIKYDATQQGMQAYQFSAEARKDGQYAWVGIQRYLAADFANSRPPKLPESLIDALESDWKNEMDDPATMTQRSGKANKVPDGLGGGKGHMYEFRGTKEKVPFVERGWVVKAGLGIFHVRTQYGGKDAETVLGADVKALLKSLKFGK
jgi:hypothetical protein